MRQPLTVALQSSRDRQIGRYDGGRNQRCTWKKGVTSDTESLFVRSLVRAAMTFAPSAEALRLEVARHMLDEQGLPDLAALFTTDEPAVRAKVRRSCQTRGASRSKDKGKGRAKEGVLKPATPITVALAGVRRHGTFEANGIGTL
ncbi:hypothetical protein [Paraburkholderia sp. MM5477-R1]|uniref:hypothetical protein n=1 Tax=Paraburkholderia sp. MM5477-R1 TaxID=2991062 RepID=UPI003D256A89